MCPHGEWLDSEPRVVSVLMLKNVPRLIQCHTLEQPDTSQGEQLVQAAAQNCCQTSQGCSTQSEDRLRLSQNCHKHTLGSGQG